MAATIWVSPRNYSWACEKWPTRDVRIDNYVPNNYVLITRPGFLNARRGKGTYKFIKLSRFK